MHNPPRILIVDDNETNRDILLTRLGTHGYDLVQAADGEEAIEVARKSLPDLILLDVMMPKLDGIAATRRLKADPSLPFMPIILVTAKTDSKDVVAGLDEESHNLQPVHRALAGFGPADVANPDGTSRTQFCHLGLATLRHLVGHQPCLLFDAERIPITDRDFTYYR